METHAPAPANRDPYLWEQAQKRVGFKQHLRTYLLINALVWIIYLVLAFALDNGRMGRFPWPLFMTGGWGIGLLSHYLGVYRSGPNPVEQEYQRLKEGR